MADEVLTEVRGRVLLITLNRPDAKNAVDTAVAQGLLAAMARLDADRELTVGVITANGSGFCSGMDLKAFTKVGPPAGFIEFLTQGSVKPLIVAIEGFAVAGGLEIALTCDIVVAARGARFGIREVAVGLFAAGGALCRLPRRLPLGVALEMALTADPILAEDAHRYGLVTHLTEPGDAVADALALAETIGRNAPLAVSATKQLMRASQGMDEAAYWELQKKHVRTVFRSDDAKEGARAFAEKRPPAWSGS